MRRVNFQLDLVNFHIRHSNRLFKAQSELMRRVNFQLDLVNFHIFRRELASETTMTAQ